MAGDSRLGGLLRHYRRASGLTQEALAERAGVSARTVSDLERGVHARARRVTVDRLADALELDGAPRASLLRAIDPAVVVAGDQPLPAGIRPRGDDIFVGRAAARGRLEEAWRDVGAGRTRIVAVQGEAGIGKSSLVARCARRWYDAGAVVLYGQCDEDSMDPYRPFVQALRELTVSLPAARVHALAAANPGLTRLLPELAAAQPAPIADQLTVLEGVRSFFEELSHDAPCVLILEDLRWSEPSSLALLRHIGRHGAGRLLVVATVRLDGSGNDHALRATVTELHRIHALDLVGLDALSLDEVRELVRGMAGIAPPRLVEYLHRETNGNPLFVRDALGVLIAADAIRDQRWRTFEGDGLAISQDVDFLVQGWFDRVPAATRALLEAAAVVGPVFDAATIGCVTELPDDEVRARLDDAVRNRLVVSGPRPGTWEFRHGVVRSGLYRELGQARRSALHRRVAHLLAASPERDDDRLAYHALRAITAPAEAMPAARYAAASAERAARLVAWEEAAVGFDLALGALEAGDVAEPALRGHLLCRLGEARTEAMQRHLARPAFLDAAQLAIELDDSDLLGRAAYGYAYMTKQGDAGDGPLDVWDRALASRQPTGIRSMLLSARSTACRLLGDPDAAGAASCEALEEARADGGTQPLRLALANRSAALWSSPELEVRIALAEELLALAGPDGPAEFELDARSLLVLPLLAAGRTTEFDRQVAAVQRLAAGSQRRFSTAQSLQWVAMRALMRGEYDAALAAGDDALDLSDGAPNFTAGHVALRYSVTRLREPGRPIDPWLAGLVEQQAGELTVWTAAVAAAHASAGDIAAARSLIRRIDPRDARRLSWSCVVTLALLAEIAAETSDRVLAADVVELLAPHSGALVVVASGTSCEGAVDHYLGRLHATLGHLDRARGLLTCAIALERRADGPALVERSERLLRSLS